MRRQPPREGVRPRPRRAAGPQRQGPHRRLQPRLGPPAPPAGAAGAAPWAVPPWTFWAPCCGCFTTPVPAAASPATRRSPARPAVPAPPSPRRSRRLEWAGVLTWQNRITRIRERCRDLFGRDGLALAGHPHLQRLRAAPAARSGLPSPTNGPEHQIKRIQSLYRHQPLTRTARSSVPLPDSPQLSQERRASNKRPAARPEPQNPVERRS